MTHFTPTNDDLRRVAELRGAEAYIDGEPVESNPYVNKTRGRVSYRAWRSGWYQAQNAHDEQVPA